MTFIYFLVFCLVTSIFTYGKQDNCQFLRRKVSVFDHYSPAGLFIYKDMFADCGITRINKMTITDYFQTESDPMISFSYLALKKNEMNRSLLNYYAKYQRWDLMLMAIDGIKKMPKSRQLELISVLFYKDLPHYINVEVQDMFVFFTEAEKIQIAQQFIPKSKKHLHVFNKKGKYLVEFLPLFDKFAYIVNTRENFPDHFDQLNLFWKDVLSSYYKDLNQDSSVKLLNHLLNKEVVNDLTNVNLSFQAFYYLKTNQFDLLRNLVKRDQQVFLNILKYFEFYTPKQQDVLLSMDINLSISVIKVLFEAYYFQITDFAFRNWVWKNAIEYEFNCDLHLTNPQLYINDFPITNKSMLKKLSPISYFLSKNPPERANIKSISKVLSSVNKQFENVKIERVLSYVRVRNFREYFKLLPYVSMEENCALIEKYDFLKRIPLRKKASWNQWFQPKLSK